MARWAARRFLGGFDVVVVLEGIVRRVELEFFDAPDHVIAPWPQNGSFNAPT